MVPSARSCSRITSSTTTRSGASSPRRLAAKARAGVDVRVVYDWLGSRRAGALWAPLSAAGAKVPGFNPPALRQPARLADRATIARRIVVDGSIGFVSGLCVSAKWLGDRGAADGSVARHGRRDPRPGGRRADARVRRQCGRRAAAIRLPAIAADATPCRSDAGDVRLRVVAGAPNETGTYRLDLVIASLARHQLWLTDAYFVGTVGLRAGARRRGARRRRRAPARAGRERHSGAVADLARRLPCAARSGCPRVRMERHDAAREDRRRRRPLGARRLDQPQHRELDGQLRARRRDRGQRHSARSWRRSTRSTSRMPPRSCSRAATACGPAEGSTAPGRATGAVGQRGARRRRRRQRRQRPRCGADESPHARALRNRVCSSR